MISKLELNGRQVHAFDIDIDNLGFAKLTDKIISMYRSNVWQEFQDGFGIFKFYSSEFDYFLSQRGVKRDDLIHGIRDINVKAELDVGMDERETGTDKRRTIKQARNENPTIPNRQMLPFGLTESEAKYLKINSRAGGTVHRPALGKRVRYGKQQKLPLLERLITAAAKLNDHDLNKLIESLKREQARRGSGPKLRLAK